MCIQGLGEKNEGRDPAADWNIELRAEGSMSHTASTRQNRRLCKRVKELCGSRVARTGKAKQAKTGRQW